jgi:4-nitrophenyl phosphatase
VKTYRLYVLDLDGTVFRGRVPTPDAPRVIDELRRRGAIVRFLTNNSSRTREHYADKLEGMGVSAEPEDVYSSAFAAGRWCAEHGIYRAFVVGEDGLEQTLAEHGVSLVRDEGTPQAVVAGICRWFDYNMLNVAMQHILAGAKFIATNPDPTYPLEDGRLEPGAGSIVAAIQTCAGVQPVVVGKPNPYLIELIMQDAGVSPAETLVVGDRTDTDIEAGRRAGCDTHLVLTGIATDAAEGSWSQDLRGLL